MGLGFPHAEPMPQRFAKPGIPFRMAGDRECWFISTRKTKFKRPICVNLLGANSLEKPHQTASGMVSIFSKEFPLQHPATSWPFPFRLSGSKRGWDYLRLACAAGGDGDAGGMDSRTASDGFSPGCVNHLLYRSRKQDPKRGTI